MDASLRTRLSTLLQEVKIVAARHRIAIPIARWRGHGVVVDRDTEILIEGYPRSANSFSVAAFDHAQGNHPRIAHHLHAPAHVLEAMRLGVPAVVLIRDPDDAVPELVLARPHVTLRQALRSYLAFYEPLLPRRAGFVVATFSEVTTDFGAVIRRVNDRYGTSFREFLHTPKSQQAVFDAMDRYWRGRVGPGDELERRVGRPSEEREHMKDALRQPYLSHALARLRDAARELHRSFTA